MPRRVQSSSRPTRLAALVTALALVVGAFTFPPPAMAQEGKRLWSLRELLGLPSAPQRNRRAVSPRVSKPPAERRQKPVKSTATRERTQGAKKAAPRAENRPAVVEEAPAPDKNADARVILVVGDFLAAGLAEGLTEAFRLDPTIRIEARSNGSSGLVRDDFYDWPAELPAMLETLKPTAVVVAVGANDRQAMRLESRRVQPRSDDWNKAYAARAAALAEAVTKAKAQLLWMGMPAFRQGRMSEDMIAFNDIYRTAVEGAGGSFVDVWEGFVDETGAYTASGPDINGQPVRLRAGDGINMTAAGKRKLAFYVQRPLAKQYGLAPSTGVVSVPPAGADPTPALPGAAAPAVRPGALGKAVKPSDRTVPVSLNDPELDGGGELLGAQAPTAGSAKGAGGGRPEAAPRAGRADYWTLPGVATAGRPAEQTSAIGR